MSGSGFRRLEGDERPRCEAQAIGRENFDRVRAGLEPVVRPGPPAATLADRHHLAQHLDAVALPDVLEEAVAEAGELRVRVGRLAGQERIVRLRAADDVVVDDAAADGERDGTGGERGNRRNGGGDY